MMGIAMYYRGLSCLLAAGFALAAAQTAQAATDTSWNGGTGGTMSSPKELYNKGNWKSGKVPSTSYNLVFGVNSLVATNNHTSANIANDIKVNGGDYTFLGSLEFATLWTADSASTNAIVKKGDWKLTYGYRQAIAENSYSAITNASGNMKITGEHYIRAGEGNNSTAIIENQAGNWTLAHHFKVANGEGSKGEIYWRKGNLSFSKDYVLYIGNGKNSTGKVEIYGGTWTPTNNMHVASGVGAAATLLLKGGTINAKGNFYIGNNTGANGAVAVDSGRLNVASGKTMYIGRGGGTGSLTVNCGTLSLGGDCVFGNGDSGSEGTLTINGGTVTVASGKWTKSGGGTGTVNLNGGTLETRHIRDDSGSIAVNFNGGTLKANEVASNGLLCHGAGSGIAVTVGEKGGTIDTGDFGISIPVAIGGAAGDGGMRFTGGGSVMLGGAVGYAGATVLDAGTILGVTSANKADVLSRLVVAIPEEGVLDGTVVLTNTTGGAVFDATDTAIDLAGDRDGRYSFVLGDGGKTIVAADSLAGKYVWTGGGSGADWKDGGKWSKDGVAGDWHDSTTAVFANAGDAATIAAGETVTVASLEFRASATVGGKGTLNAVLPVVVSDGADAAVNAPMASALVKEGPGTLTLGASRTGPTTLSDGTLVMSGAGTTLDWTKFTFGTDPLKPVTLKFRDGATPANISPMGVSAEDMDITLVKECGDWNVAGDFRFPDSSGTAARFFHEGGSLTVSANMCFCDNLGAKPAIVEIGGGTVDVAEGVIFGYSSADAVDVLNLNGGTLFAKKLGRSKKCSPSLNFNGGTLKAKADGNLIDTTALAMTACENGGIIDANGRTVAFRSAISGAGGMTFKGGGVVTLASGNTYTGVTTVEVGTTVHVPAPGEIVGGLAVTLPETPPADGVYTLLVCDGEGAFADSVLKVVAAPDNSRLLVTTGGKSVVCIYGDDPGPLWVGGTSGSLGEAANWANNAVPGAGVNCVIGSVAAASLTNPSGSAFAPASITFPADSAAVAISGENPITGIAAITNLSPTVSHTINVPVCFAGDIQVRQNADYYEHMAEPHIVFAGGAHAGEGRSIETGSTVKWSRCMFGEYSIDSAADARWTATQYSNCRPAVTDNSSLYVPYAGALKELYLGTNAKVFVGDMELAERLMYRMGAGAEMVVTNLTVTGSDNRYVSYNQGTSVPGTFKFKSVTNSLTGDDKRFYLADGHIASRHVFFIGEGGLNFLNAGATSYYNLGRGDGGNAETIRPWCSDFTIAGSDGRGDSGWDVILDGAIDFCTDDENETGRTITIDAVTRATAETAITVSGKGTLRVDKAAINYGQPAVTVSDTATLAYARGASLGTGPLALGAGTTLVVASDDLPISVASLALPESGKATIQVVGDAALADGSYEILSSTAGLPAGFWEKLDIAAPAGTGAMRRLYTTDNGTMKLLVGEGSLPYTWTGAANDGKMNTPGNWIGGEVPTEGAMVFIPPTAGEIDNDIEGFAPASITFGQSGSGVVTIGGNPISGVAAITNLSGMTHVFNAPVAFADKILVVQGAMSWEQKSGTSIRFAGGVTGTTFADGTARYLDGAYSLSTGAGWVATTQGSNNRWGISTGSSLTLPEATHINELYVGSGAAFTTGVHRTSARLLCYNYGEYVVTNEFAATFPEEGTHYCGWDSISNGKFKFEKITLSGGTGSNPILKFGNASSSTADTGTQQFYIGRGGLCFAEGACNTLRYEAGGAKNNATVRIDPWHGDYTIHTKSASNPTDFTVSTKTYFGTTDESGKACTVTDDGVIASYDVGEIHIDGKGTFVVNAVGKATCPATVHGGSGTTLAIKAGKKLTTGLITVNSGATLQVSKSGTVSLGGLMLKSGATLGFTFTKRGAAPILKLSGALGEFTVPIRVCSYNIRCITNDDSGDKAWDNRKAALVKLVKNIDPDIIGFQEVKDDQFTYLKQQLPDYDFLSKNRGGSSGGNEAVSIAWRKARFSKTAGGTFWLSGTPSKESKFEESDRNRICTWALFNDSCTGRQFCFANTHLDLKEAARPKQMQVIMDQLSKYFDNGVPFALTGDMNCDERASPIKDVAYAHLSDACLVSRTAPTGPWRTYNGWNYKDASAESPCASVMEEPVSERNIGGRSRIDFMLTSQNVGVASFAIRNDPQSGKKQYPSDHFPIVGELLPATGGGGKYKVKVDRSCPHVSAGRHVLTQGAKLANADNIDFDLPKWVERAAVEDGEIVLYAKPAPSLVSIR